MRGPTAAWGLALALLAGCHRSTQGGVRMEQVTMAFDDAGWKGRDLRTLDPARLSAQKCVGGTLNGVDTVLCEYGGVDAVRAGQKAVEGWVAGAVTGVSLTNGRTVLGLADRTRTDPLGKSIHAITRAYAAVK